MKKFSDKIFDSKDSKIFDYGCVLMDLNIPNWNEITKMIDPKDVYKPEDKAYGVEKFPHITVLYGIHADYDPKKVAEIISEYKNYPFNLQVKGIGYFNTKDFDVVKFNVEKNNTLINFNKKLCTLPYTSDFDYIPHITIAYVLPGTAKKYENQNYSLGKPWGIEITRIKYSNPKGEDLIYNL